MLATRKITEVDPLVMFQGEKSSTLRSSGWSPFLGKVPLLGRASLGRVPKFEITITNAGITKMLSATFDTGLEGFDIEMPTSIAQDLGILPNASGQATDFTQSINILVGIVDEVTIPSAPGCSLTKAAVSYSDNFSRVMVGNGFLKAIGAQISYQDGMPSVKCGDLPPGGQIMAPAFMMTFVQGQKVMDTDAYFDTGFDGDLCLPDSIARQMGLSVYDYEEFRTHTGTVRQGKAKMDRMTMKHMPACWADAVEVSVSPESAPLQDILVGEGFMKKVDGRIGYDKSGALFSCGASGGFVARPVAYTHVTKGDIPTRGISPALWLALGGAGVLLLGVVGYHFWK